LDLNTLGWSERWTCHFSHYSARGLVPARVSSGARELCTVIGEQGEMLAEVSGRFRQEAAGKSDYPVVGDWCAVAPRPSDGGAGIGRATIHGVLPRASAFSRKSAGEIAEEQVVAANIDTVLIVMGLDGDYNVRRLERYLTLAWGSGVQPVIVLNKADLCPETEERVAETLAVAVGAPVVAVAALSGGVMDALRGHLAPGKTAALLGSSGVGKSTILNRLLGEERMATGGVRADDSRGRHTTTRRELVILPSGALLIDNPGMREVGLWGGEEILADSFSDVAALARGCRFSDCTHAAEPGCAVREALRDGTLDERRFEGWAKLQRELAFLARQTDVRARLEHEKRWKTIAKYQKTFRKDRRSG
jgi:ribosome biogenesis GTPase / thiamine phosphate phosphatase